MMQLQIKTYRYLIAACLLLLGCIAPIRAVAQTRQSSSWGYTSSYNSMSSTYRPSATTNTGYGTTYRGFSSGRNYTPQLSGDINPSYNFHSTSPYQSITEKSFGISILSEPLRDEWNDPDDNEIGTVDDLQPIGEPLILLLFALLYFAIKKGKWRMEKFNASQSDGKTADRGL